MNSQVIVIDAKGHLFGRLASIVSKQLLQGQHVVRIDFGDARAFAMGAIIAAHRGGDGARRDGERWMWWHLCDDSRARWAARRRR